MIVHETATHQMTVECLTHLLLSCIFILFVLDTLANWFFLNLISNIIQYIIFTRHVQVCYFHKNKNVLQQRIDYQSGTPLNCCH